jgi:hypothetical protein
MEGSTSTFHHCRRNREYPSYSCALLEEILWSTDNCNVKDEKINHQRQEMKFSRDSRGYRLPTPTYHPYYLAIHNQIETNDILYNFNPSWICCLNLSDRSRRRIQKFKRKIRENAPWRAFFLSNSNPHTHTHTIKINIIKTSYYPGKCTV